MPTSMMVLVMWNPARKIAMKKGEAMGNSNTKPILQCLMAGDVAENLVVDAAAAAGRSDPTPRRKAKSKAKAKGNKHCRGCNSWLSRESFPPGSAYCIIDKKVVQNLRYAARTQGKLDWYQEVLNDDKLILKACQNYKVRSPRDHCLGRSGQVVAAEK